MSQHLSPPSWRCLRTWHVVPCLMRTSAGCTARVSMVTCLMCVMSLCYHNHLTVGCVTVSEVQTVLCSIFCDHYCQVGVQVSTDSTGGHRGTIQSPAGTRRLPYWHARDTKVEKYIVKCRLPIININNFIKHAIAGDIDDTNILATPHPRPITRNYY